MIISREGEDERDRRCVVTAVVTMTMKMIVVVGAVEVPRTPRGQVQVLAPPYINPP